MSLLLGSISFLGHQLMVPLFISGSCNWRRRSGRLGARGQSLTTRQQQSLGRRLSVCRCTSLRQLRSSIRMIVGRWSAVCSVCVVLSPIDRSKLNRQAAHDTRETAGQMMDASLAGWLAGWQANQLLQTQLGGNHRRLTFGTTRRLVASWASGRRSETRCQSRRLVASADAR